MIFAGSFGSGAVNIRISIIEPVNSVSTRVQPP
jgi:hypothetical protein